MTFGERIKEYRKNRGFTQSELAERLGISEQSVSKWETGITMPDVSILVPLSSLLGVSVDSLLGVKSNCDDEINAAYKELSERWSGDGKELGYCGCNVTYDYYKTTSALTKKHPTNMRIAKECASYAQSVLNLSKRGCFELSEKEKTALFEEVEFLTNRVWKFDETVSGKRWAKQIFISACCDMGYYGRAESESECLGDGIEHAIMSRVIAERRPMPEKKDIEDALLKRRITASYHTINALEDHYWTINRLGSFGDVTIPETVKAFNDFLAILEAYKGVFSEGIRLDLKIDTLNKIAEKYCCAGEYDKALDVAEMIGDTAEEYYRIYKDGAPECLLDLDRLRGKSEYSIEYTDKRAKEDLYWRTTFWTVFGDKENNPIVTSPRYKAVVEKINNLS